MATITAIFMTCSISVVSYANTAVIDIESKNLLEDLLYTVVNDNSISISNGSFSVSEAIPTYILENNNVREFEEAEYRIVYSDEIPVGIFTKNAANTSKPTYSFSEDFVHLLDEQVLSASIDYTLLVTESQMFAVTSTQAIELSNLDVGYIIIDVPVVGDANTYSTEGKNDIVAEYEPIEYVASQIFEAVQSDSLLSTNSKTTEELDPILEKKIRGGS